MISVTESGDDIASRAVQAVEDQDRAFFSGLGDEIGVLNRLLQQLAKH